MKRVWLIVAVVVMISGFVVKADDEKAKHEASKEKTPVTNTEKTDKNDKTEKTDKNDKTNKTVKKDPTQRLMEFIDACTVKRDEVKVPAGITQRTH